MADARRPIAAHALDIENRTQIMFTTTGYIAEARAGVRREATAPVEGALSELRPLGSPEVASALDNREVSVVDAGHLPAERRPCGPLDDPGERVLNRTPGGQIGPSTTSASWMSTSSGSDPSGSTSR